MGIFSDIFGADPVDSILNGMNNVYHDLGGSDREVKCPKQQDDAPMQEITYVNMNPTIQVHAEKESNVTVSPEFNINMERKSYTEINSEVNDSHKTSASLGIGDSAIHAIGAAVGKVFGVS